MNTHSNLTHTDDGKSSVVLNNKFSQVWTAYPSVPGTTLAKRVYGSDPRIGCVYKHCLRCKAAVCLCSWDVGCMYCTENQICRCKMSYIHEARLLPLEQIMCFYKRRQVKTERRNIISEFFNKQLSRELFDDMYMKHYLLTYPSGKQMPEDLSVYDLNQVELEEKRIKMSEYDKAGFTADEMQEMERRERANAQVGSNPTLEEIHGEAPLTATTDPRVIASRQTMRANLLKLRQDQAAARNSKSVEEEYGRRQHDEAHGKVQDEALKSREKRYAQTKKPTAAAAPYVAEAVAAAVVAEAAAAAAAAAPPNLPIREDEETDEEDREKTPEAAATVPPGFDVGHSWA